MDVELLFWAGCPSYPAALAELRAALADLGVDAEVALVEVRDDGDAVARDFPGSPTVRVGGHDLFPIDSPPGLTCRVYHRRDGRIAPTPDPADLRDALRGMLPG